MGDILDDALFWNIDDNVWGVSANRSIELYKEMARQVRGKRWLGSGDILTLRHSRAGELLDVAREEVAHRPHAELFTLLRILRRIPRIGAKGFPMPRITSWMVEYPQRRAFQELAREHDRMTQTHAL